MPQYMLSFVQLCTSNTLPEYSSIGHIMRLTHSKRVISPNCVAMKRVRSEMSKSNESIFIALCRLVRRPNTLSISTKSANKYFAMRHFYPNCERVISSVSHWHSVQLAIKTNIRTCCAFFAWIFTGKCDRTNPRHRWHFINFVNANAFSCHTLAIWQVSLPLFASQIAIRRHKINKFTFKDIDTVQSRQVHLLTAFSTRKASTCLFKRKKAHTEMLFLLQVATLAITKDKSQNTLSRDNSANTCHRLRRLHATQCIFDSGFS